MPPSTTTHDDDHVWDCQDDEVDKSIQIENEKKRKFRRRQKKNYNNNNNNNETKIAKFSTIAPSHQTWAKSNPAATSRPDMIALANHNSVPGNKAYNLYVSRKFCIIFLWILLLRTPVVVYDDDDDDVAEV